MTAMDVTMERDVSSTANKPIDLSVHRWNIATQSLCIILMTIFFALRVYARNFILKGFSMEDCEYLHARDGLS